MSRPTSSESSPQQNSVWFPDNGEVEEDGVHRVARGLRPYGGAPRPYETMREMVEDVAERDWSESASYWPDAVLRVRWQGSLYEYEVEVESVPSFRYAARELSEPVKA